MIKLWGESPACDKPWIVSYFNWHQPKVHWSGSQMKHEVFNVGNVGWNQHEMIGKTLYEIWQIGTVAYLLGCATNQSKAWKWLKWPGIHDGPYGEFFFLSVWGDNRARVCSIFSGYLERSHICECSGLRFLTLTLLLFKSVGLLIVVLRAVGGDGPGPMSKAWCEGSKSSWIGGEKKSCCQPATWNSEARAASLAWRQWGSIFWGLEMWKNVLSWGVDTFVILQKVDGSARLYQAQGQAEVGHCIAHWCS